MIRTIFIYLYIGVAILACNDQHADQDAILQQPPYLALTDSIKSEPSNADLYYRRGVLLYSHEQLSLAKKDIRTAYQLAPNEKNAAGVAQVLAKENEDSVILFLQQAVKKIPESLSLKITLAKHYQQQGENEKAMDICNRVLQTYPNQIDALLLVAGILKVQNKPQEALSVMEKAYRYAPFDVELVYDLAFEYAMQKNNKALTLSDSLLSKDSSKTHAEPFYFKGLYYENSGNRAQALQYLDEAIQHDYYFLDAYMEKGQLLYDQKKYSEALSTFQLAARVSPTFADAYLWMGKCEEAAGHKGEAKLNYQRAYSLDTSLTTAQEAAARL